MSKSSKKNSKNFEQLYFSLKEEYDQMMNDNNEIFKEYESTIQMLTDSIKELQNQRNAMTKKLSQIEKEKENFQNKNKEKIIDIQELNKKNESLIKEMEKIKEEKKAKDNKIIFLENDNEYFQKIIRQDEAIIDELNIKLEEMIEENITIQTEFEIYKQIMNEQIMRKEDEIKEIKNDIFSKDFIIKKLKNKKEVNYIMKNKLFKNKYKAGISKNKRNNTKINNSYDYTHDNNYTIAFGKEKELFNQIISYNKKVHNITPNITNQPIINLLSSLSPIKNTAKKYILKISHSKYGAKSDNKKYSLITPSNKIIDKDNNERYNSSRYLMTKHIDNKKEYEYVNKFVINDNDYDDNDFLKNDDTTVALSMYNYKNKDDSFSFIDNDYPSNLVSNERTSTDIIICDNKNIEIEPFRDVFLKKLRNSKKLSHNMEKLMNFNKRKKKKEERYIKVNLKNKKIGYKLK